MERLNLQFVCDSDSAACRVQLASLSLGEMTQHLNHSHYYVDHVLKLGFIISQTIVLAKHLGGFLNILITIISNYVSNIFSNAYNSPGIIQLCLMYE